MLWHSKISNFLVGDGRLDPEYRSRHLQRQQGEMGIHNSGVWNVETGEDMALKPYDVHI